MKNLDTYLKVALRAQSQCRATWEALGTIQNPPVMGYVRQANIAHGPLGGTINPKSSMDNQLMSLCAGHKSSPPPPLLDLL